MAFRLQCFGFKVEGFGASGFHDFKVLRVRVVTA